MRKRKATGDTREESCGRAENQETVQQMRQESRNKKPAPRGFRKTSSEMNEEEHD